MNYFKCSICGRFLSYDELRNGNASHKLITPDSAYTFEEWDTYHNYDCLKTKRIPTSRETSNE